jgi:hypothetical protein
MADQVFRHAEKAPASRVASDSTVAVFFPGEVARLLGLRGVDYAQLRQLFVLARTLRGEDRPGRGWARFTLADLAATEVLVALGGGRDALATNRRLVLGEVEGACQALRRLGFDNPLLQVPMARQGRQILARVGSHVIDPRSGQLALSTAGDMIDAFLKVRLIKDRQVRSAIRAERRRVRPARARKVVSGGLGTLSEIVVR